MLTEKQKRFADFYIETGNYYDSAIRAGYSENYSKAQSYKLLDNVGIKEYIDNILNKKDKERIASQDEVLEYYTRLLRGEELDIFVYLDKNGDQLEKKVSPSLRERTKAAEALAKRYRLFDEKFVVNNNNNNYDLSKLTTEQIKELLNKDE